MPGIRPDASAPHGHHSLESNPVSLAQSPPKTLDLAIESKQFRCRMNSPPRRLLAGCSAVVNSGELPRPYSAFAGGQDYVKNMDREYVGMLQFSPNREPSVHYRGAKASSDLLRRFAVISGTLAASDGRCFFDNSDSEQMF